MLQLCTIFYFGAIQKTKTQIQKHCICVSWCFLSVCFYCWSFCLMHSLIPTLLSLEILSFRQGPFQKPFSPWICVWYSLIVWNSSPLTLNACLVSHCVCACVLVAQSCLTLCNPVDCSLLGSSVHGIFQVRMHCHFLLLTQGLNTYLLCLWHCRQILYPLSHQDTFIWHYRINIYRSDLMFILSLITIAPNIIMIIVTF